MSTVVKPVLSPEQYLLQERAASFKSEFYRGETFAMAGASREHNLIVANIVGEVRNALKDRRCEVYPSDLRVRVSPTGLYTYPDATVVCNDAEFEDEKFDTLLNPTVLIEVLSDSTEAYDRGAKFAQYRHIDSLREYVMIAQDRMSIECYARCDESGWLLREFRTLEESARIESLGIQIPLAEIYRNVQLPTNE